MRSLSYPYLPHLSLYNRTPEELLTQKLWRLRVKFLFSSTSITSVRIQSLSLSFQKRQIASARKGGSSFAGGMMSGAVPTVVGTVGGQHDHPLLYRGGSASTSTTASMSTTPTGTSTPCSDSIYEDVSELSVPSDGEDGASTTSSADGGGRRQHSGKKEGGRRKSGASSSSSSGGAAADREAIRNLMAVIDQVIEQGNNGSSVLIEELIQLKTRLVDHLNDTKRSSDQDLNSTIARISSIIQSVVR